MIICTSKTEAWEIAQLIAKEEDFEYDNLSSNCAGYPVYRAKNHKETYVCDLNTRLEVNIRWTSRNVWITGD